MISNLRVIDMEALTLFYSNSAFLLADLPKQTGMTLHSSPLGRGAHRDDRRRRLMAEDRSANLGPAEDGVLGPGVVPTANHKSEHYGDAAFLDDQLRLTDLIPRRLITVLLLPAIGGAAIACLITLYVATPKVFGAADRMPLAAVLGCPGSLGNWLSALLLLAASFYSLVNYSIRRHKTDDYHGRYRVWLWAAACWFLMATDAAGSLHQAVEAAVISLTHMRLVGNGSIWWIAPVALLLGIVGTRLFIDIWPSRSARVTTTLAAIAYLAASLAFFHIVRLPTEVADSLLLNGSLLAGHLLFAWSMALNARFVLLDAEGRLPRRSAKPKAKKKRLEKAKSKASGTSSGPSSQRDAAIADARDRDDSDDAESCKTWTKVHPPHAGPTPSSSSTLKRVSPLAAHMPSSAASQSDCKMSKADRKALKKKILEERLKSEQRRASNW
jgi:hypothetical protein